MSSFENTFCSVCEVRIRRNKKYSFAIKLAWQLFHKHSKLSYEILDCNNFLKVVFVFHLLISYSVARSLYKAVFFSFIRWCRWLWNKSLNLLTDNYFEESQYLFYLHCITPAEFSYRFIETELCRCTNKNIYMKFLDFNVNTFFDFWISAFLNIILNCWANVRLTFSIFNDVEFWNSNSTNACPGFN